MTPLTRGLRQQAIIAAELVEDREVRCQAVREAVEALTGRLRTVADSLMADRRRKDIAATLGITPQAVGHYYRRLAIALARC